MYSSCSVTCGEGEQSRTRQCEGGICSLANPDDLIESQPCNVQDCAAEFTDWSDWSACSVTCGNGVSTRTRTCESYCSSVTSSDLTNTQVCDEGGPCGSPCIDYRMDTHCSGVSIQQTTIEPSPNGPSDTAYEAVGGYNVCASLCIGVSGCVSFNWTLNPSGSGICELYSSGRFSSKVKPELIK